MMEPYIKHCPNCNFKMLFHVETAYLNELKKIIAHKDTELRKARKQRMVLQDKLNTLWTDYYIMKALISI